MNATLTSPITGNKVTIATDGATATVNGESDTAPLHLRHDFGDAATAALWAHGIRGSLIAGGMHDLAEDTAGA